MHKQQFFKGCSTVEDVKKLYRKLAMQCHPDRNPDDKEGATAQMKEINQQYQAALKGQHGSSRVGSDGKSHTYYYNEEHETEIADKIAECIALFGDLLTDDVFELALIGKWLWVTGDTKPHKDVIKGAGFKWHRGRSCWYWRPYQYRSYGRNKGSLEEIAGIYGSSRIKGNGRGRQTGKALAA